MIVFLIHPLDLFQESLETLHSMISGYYWSNGYSVKGFVKEMGPSLFFYDLITNSCIYKKVLWFLDMSKSVPYKMSISGKLPKFVVDMGEYKVMGVNETYLGMTYSDLIQDWHNWVFSHQPDDQVDTDLTYLRGDMLGDPIYPQELGLDPSDFSVVEDVRTVYDRRGLKGLTITNKTAIFHPVYGSFFAVGDKYRGKTLITTNECRISAREEFKFVSKVWAVYRDLNTTTKESKPVIGWKPANLFDFYAECTAFDLTASAGNRVNREAGFYLQGPKTYEGVAVGIFLLLFDFRAGAHFQLDFGGCSGFEYNTRAVYDIKVVNATDQSDKDISKEVVDLPYPPNRKADKGPPVKVVN